MGFECFESAIIECVFRQTDADVVVPTVRHRHGRRDNHSLRAIPQHGLQPEDLSWPLDRQMPAGRLCTIEGMESTWNDDNQVPYTYTKKIRYQTIKNNYFTYTITFYHLLYGQSFTIIHICIQSMLVMCVK